MKRNIAVGLVVAAIVVGGAVGWTVSRVDRQDTVVATSSKVPAMKIIDFRTGADKHGLEVFTTAAVSKLTGTSDAFKQFVTANIERLSATNKTLCPNAAVGFVVNKYATSGYAMGSVADCGGYGALWGVRDGAWKELIATQDIWHCGQLHQYGVPKGLLDDPRCYDEATDKVITYAG